VLVLEGEHVLAYLAHAPERDHEQLALFSCHNSPFSGCHRPKVRRYGAVLGWIGRRDPSWGHAFGLSILLAAIGRRRSQDRAGSTLGNRRVLRVQSSSRRGPRGGRSPTGSPPPRGPRSPPESARGPRS